MNISMIPRYRYGVSGVCEAKEINIQCSAEGTEYTGSVQGHAVPKCKHYKST